MANAPRIGISGSAGTGKSTLARSLANRLSVPYIPEGMRERLEAGLDLHDLSHAELRDLLVTMFQEMTALTETEQTNGGGFVCDRAPIDYMAFWLYYGFGADENATQEFFASAERASGAFELIVILPWNAFPLINDGIRSPNRWRQLHFQALVEGLALRGFGSVGYEYIPLDVVCQGDRMAWVMDYLATAPVSRV